MLKSAPISVTVSISQYTDIGRVPYADIGVWQESRCQWAGDGHGIPKYENLMVALFFTVKMYPRPVIYLHIPVHTVTVYASIWQDVMLSGFQMSR